MVTERLRSMFVAALLLIGPSGCASVGQRTDLARLQSLTDMPMPQELGPVNVDLEPEVEDLLAKPLDLDTAVQVAILNNRPLRATLRELGIERGMLIDARAVPNPTVEVELLPERNTEIEMRVEYEISELILAPLRARVARFELDQARYQAAGEVVSLGYRVRAAYRQMQAARERLAVAQRRLDALAAARDAAMALGEAGSFNELESASQIVSYERARVSVSNLELELAARREVLQRLLGLHGEHANWELADSLPPIPAEMPTMDGIENVAVERSLELAAGRSHLEALAHRTGLERTEGWLPEIAVDYHALVGDPTAMPSAGDGRWRNGAGISVGIPLFNQNRGKTRAAEAEFDGQYERYIGATIDIRSAAREVGNHVRAAHGVAQHIGGVVIPAQRRVLDQTLLQYNAMQLGVFELLAAEQALLDVQLAELEARADYWVADAALVALLAGVRPELEATSSQTSSLEMGASAQGGH
jgi:cobalt-zinc-cadmium efflux system outer membrane protein